MRRLSSGVVIATIASGVLLLGGVIMFLAASPTSMASFGWFAHQPVAGATFFPGSFVVLTPLMATAAVISIIGLVGVSVIAGYAAGRHQRATS